MTSLSSRRNLPLTALPSTPRESYKNWPLKDPIQPVQDMVCGPRSFVANRNLRQFQFTTCSAQIHPVLDMVRKMYCPKFSNSNLAFVRPIASCNSPSDLKTWLCPERPQMWGPKPGMFRMNEKQRGMTFQNSFSTNRWVPKGLSALSSPIIGPSAVVLLFANLKRFASCQQKYICLPPWSPFDKATRTCDHKTASTQVDSSKLACQGCQCNVAVAKRDENKALVASKHQLLD